MHTYLYYVDPDTDLENKLRIDSPMLVEFIKNHSEYLNYYRLGSLTDNALFFELCKTIEGRE